MNKYQHFSSRHVHLVRRSMPLRLLSHVGLLCLVLAPFAPAAGETWAERLGFPADRKVVILHAHDAGLCFETNAATEQLLSKGVVQSTSVMAPAPWFADSARWAHAHGDLDVGLQFTLNSELPAYRWQPVADRHQVPSLVDAEGFLWSSPLQTMVNGDVADVRYELETQLGRAQKAGLRPSHLTTHLGTLFSRLEYAQVYLQFAQRHWIPAVVVELTPEQLDGFRQQGFPLPDELVRLIDAYPFPKVDGLQILPVTETAEQKRTALFDIVANLPPGLTQIACAPATPSEALKRIDPQWQQRVWELELLTDPTLQEMLTNQQIILTNWREIMRRFEDSL